MADDDLPTGLILLIPILTLVPMVVALEVRGFPASFALAGLAVAVLFAVLLAQGYGQSALRVPLLFTLILVALAVALLVLEALGGIGRFDDVRNLLIVPALLLAIVALWQALAGRDPLPHLVFILAAVIVAGSLTGVASPMLGLLIGLVLVLGWPLVERSGRIPR